MKKKHYFKNIVFCVVCCGIIGFTAGIGIPAASYLIDKKEAAVTAEKEADNISTDTNGNISTTMDESSANTVNIIKQVKPSIACITSLTQGVDFFYQPYQSEGAGSGIVFYKDSEYAYIATNNHVISGANSVSISLNECDLVAASLVGKDANADLAVIKVSLNDLKNAGVTNVQVAQFGDSDQTEVGETVIAIGNALGQGNTATRGILSSQAKDVNIQGRKLTVIQTDAAINPGNSGGALVNSKGQVIGINTAKISMSEIEGIGYSIASNVAKPIIEQLMNNTDAPALGVYITSVTEDIAKQWGLPQAGVLVQEIIPGGSAEAAGIKTGDLITSFNDQPIFTTDQLTAAVKACKIDQTVSVKLIRNGSEMSVNVKLLKSTNTGF